MFKINFNETISSFQIAQLHHFKVPVLSEHKTSILAISSMDPKQVTIAFRFESATAATAIVMDNTAGIATGIDATINIPIAIENEKNIYTICLQCHTMPHIMYISIIRTIAYKKMKTQ